MSRFGFRMDWIRYFVLWIIHPDILLSVGKIFKKIFYFGRKETPAITAQKTKELPPPKMENSPNGLADVNPSSSVPVLEKYTLMGGKNDTGFSQNCGCKNLLRDFCLNQAGLSDHLCEKFPKIFMPARVENLRLKTMEALNLDHVYQ